MMPTQPQPLDRTLACAKDATNPESCICGNCANGAVSNTCLRYTAVGGAWRLAECRPGVDCGAVFPQGSGARAGDTIVSCPCRAQAPAAPTPPPAHAVRAPASAAGSPAPRACAPQTPGACEPPSGLFASLRDVFCFVGIAASVGAVVWLAFVLLRPKNADGELPPLPPAGLSDGADVGLTPAGGTSDPALGTGPDALTGDQLAPPSTADLSGSLSTGL